MSRFESELQKAYKDPTFLSDERERGLVDAGLRITSPLVTQMLDQIGLGGDTTTPINLLDQGCGTGAVVAELQRRLPPDVLAKSTILSSDIAERMVDLVKQRAEKEAWVNAEAKVIDAQNTELPPATFTHVTVSLGFHVIPNSEAALKEAIRMLEPGGTLALTTWHRNGTGWLADLPEAFESLPFAAPTFSIPTQMTAWGKWDDVNWVRHTLLANGLQDVKVNVYAHLSHIDSADHFMVSAGMPIDWCMKATWSDELQREHGADEVKALVKDFVEKKYAGQGWDLSWMSIIASGRVPL